MVAYGPLAHGLLTGKYTRARLAGLPEGDWRRRGARFQEPELTANLAFVEGLRRIAEGEGCSLADLAIAWVLRRPEIASAIVGARSPAQIAETMKYADQALSAEVLGRSSVCSTSARAGAENGARSRDPRARERATVATHATDRA